QIFEEAVFNIYMNHELIEIRRPQRTEAEKAMKSRPIVFDIVINMI
ncbi:10760_t:CDS:2, partial [Gigaspora rosea]